MTSSKVAKIYSCASTNLLIESQRVSTYLEDHLDEQFVDEFREAAKKIIFSLMAQPLPHPLLNGTAIKKNLFLRLSLCICAVQPHNMRDRCTGNVLI